MEINDVSRSLDALATANLPPTPKLAFVRPPQKQAPGRDIPSGRLLPHLVGLTKLLRWPSNFSEFLWKSTTCRAVLMLSQQQICRRLQSLPLYVHHKSKRPDGISPPGACCRILWVLPNFCAGRQIFLSSYGNQRRVAQS